MRNLPRVYTSFMPNAPILNGVPGALLDIIKKCLIGGWTPFDATAIEVSGGKATLKYNIGTSSLPDWCRIMISGCDEPQLNKEWSITRGGDSQSQFETTVADGTYGGAIKVTFEPAGWELMFSGTNEAVMRSSNTDGSGTVVKIVDQNATTAGFDFAYDAVAIDKLIDNARSVDNVERNILKSRNADPSHFRGWYIVCDNSTVYIVTDMFTPGGSTPHSRDMLRGGRLYFWGDYISNDPHETEAFGAYFQNIGVGATANNLNYGNASPQWTGFWSEDWNTGRPLLRLPQSAYTKWYWAVFNPNPDLVNNNWRINGAGSALDLNYVKNIESTYRIVPVHGRITGPGGAQANFGRLAGYMFSDYHIRMLFSNFTSSVDKDGNTYLYTPVDHSNRDNNNTNETMGSLVFQMNKKWGP